MTNNETVRKYGDVAVGVELLNGKVVHGTVVDEGEGNFTIKHSEGGGRSVIQEHAVARIVFRD